MSTMKFEKALKRLEAIVDQLEDGQLDLESPSSSSKRASGLPDYAPGSSRRPSRR